MNSAEVLATNLRTLMVERGVSPRDLAQRCSLEPATVEAILLGDNRSTLAHIDQLLAYVNVSLSELLASPLSPSRSPKHNTRKLLQHYWALPSEQRASVDIFVRTTECAVESAQSPSCRQGSGQFLSDAERGALLNGFSH